MSTPRQQLAEQQAALTRALTHPASAAAGFDDARIQLTREMLLRKRRQQLAKSVPLLLSALGDRFDTLFTEFASAHPLPVDAPSSDARAFAIWLSRHRPGDRESLDIVNQTILGRRRWITVYRWGIVIRLPFTSKIVGVHGP